MLNIFSNTKSWMLASLMTAASIFGQSKEMNATDSCRPKTAAPKPACPPKPCCEPVPQIQLIPAYNAAARIDVRGCWDLYFGASFIYWQAMQDNMTFAASVVSNQTDPFTLTIGDSRNKTTGNMISQEFEYKPGFKVLAGMNLDHDNWDVYAEYTWFKSTTTTSVDAQDISKIELLKSTGIYPCNGNPDLIDQKTAFNSGSQEWKLKFQALDAALARTYYVGKKLTFRSIFGARFAWFTQIKEQSFVNTGNLTNVAAHIGNSTLSQNYSSWGAGILAGLNTNWIIGEGFRVIGNGSVDMLYTRVQTSNYKDRIYQPTGPGITWAFPQSRPDFVMPHMDLEFGFGWSSYFDCNNWHVDFLATYGFQTFWNANLFRQFNDDVQTASSIMPNGNLYIHGLTVSARLDF